MGGWLRRRLWHNKERQKVVVEEDGSEAVRQGKTIEAIIPHEKEQEGEVDIVMEKMHSRSDPAKGDITYRC